MTVSIHRSTQIRQGKPYRQNINAILASAIPTTAERLSVQLEMVVDSKSLLEQLASIVNAGAFATIATLVPQLAAAAAPIQKMVTSLVGLIRASSKTTLMTAAYEFDLSQGAPKSGYYVFLGSVDSRSPLPSVTQHGMQFTTPEQLTHGGKAFNDWSWLVLEVTTRPAMGREYGARGDKRPWYSVLELARSHVRETVERGDPLTRKDTHLLNRYVSDALSLARSLFIQDSSYLSSERDSILEEAFLELTEIAAEVTKPEAKGLIEGPAPLHVTAQYLFSEEIARLLGESDLREIEKSVANYRAVLESLPHDLTNFLGY